MKRFIAGISCLCLSAGAYAGFNDGLAAYQKKDYATAYQEFKTAAEQGNTDAQYNLGILYENGEGVPRDIKQAFYWYEKVAYQGYPKAQYKIGDMYVEGKGVGQDLESGTAWFRKAADQDYAPAQFAAGYFLSSPALKSEDDKTAAEYLYKSGMHGTKSAQVALGKMYCRKQFLNPKYAIAGTWLQNAAHDGDLGAEVFLGERASDYKDSIYWLSSAAKQGDGRAMVQLGTEYLHPQDDKVLHADTQEAKRLLGDGIIKLRAQASSGDSDAMYYIGMYYQKAGYNDAAGQWFLKAAKGGHKDAHLQYGRLLDHDDAQQAMTWYAERARQGWAREELVQAHRYDEGYEDIKQDREEAAKWFRLAADQGNDEAQRYLGYYFNNGLGGFPKDYLKAKNWFLMAANDGDPDASELYGLLLYTHRPARNLGEPKIYSNNKGLIAEFSAVAKRIRARQTSDPEAQFLMGLLYSQGVGVAQDDAQAVKWLKLAAAKGHPRAQALLGTYYRNGGGGLKKDPAEAMKLFQSASQHGYAYASELIAFMYEEGNGVEKSGKKSLDWYRKAANQGSWSAMQELRKLSCGTSDIY